MKTKYSCPENIQSYFITRYTECEVCLLIQKKKKKYNLRFMTDLLVSLFKELEKLFVKLFVVLFDLWV